MKYFFIKIQLIGVALLLFISGYGFAQTIHGVSAVPLTAGTQAVLRIELSQERVTPNDAQFAFILPADFYLTTVLFADSRALNGGFSIAVRMDTVWVFRSGLGAVLPANEKMDIMIATVGLPEDISAVYPFQVVYKDSSTIRTADVRLRLTANAVE